WPASNGPATSGLSLRPTCAWYDGVRTAGCAEEGRLDSAPARPLKVGVVLPQVEGMLAGGTARWSDLLAIAQTAEAVGFDSVWVVDHFLFPPRAPGGPGLGCWECGSLLGALAAATHRVELGTFVVNTGFRNPTLLAKMADTVEEISGGRL